MSDLAARVTAALARSILPTVIARGATTLRVVGVDDAGVVTLRAGGSPGAVLPILGRIERQLRAAVPGVSAVRMAAGDEAAQAAATTEASGTTEAARTAEAEGTIKAAGTAGALTAAAAQRVLDAEVNPTIAAHRGHVTVVGAEQGWVLIRLEGGCQGCSLAEVTIRQGIEPVLRTRLPGLIGVRDVTDHDSGSGAFFSPEKR